MPEFPAFANAAAIRALKRRGQKPEPSAWWWTVWQKQHQTAFTVAQSAGYDILADIYDALQTAMRTGISYEKFAASLTPALQAKGWWGKTQDGRQLGAPWRLKTIFQQNLRVSAAQGEWESIQELKKDRPYLRYSALVDGRTRPLHKSWHGTILPVDDPWWNTHFPPNGWNCRCKALSVSEAELKFYGWQVSGKAPDDGWREWLNPGTGQIARVPNGIDPGWDYNPGAVDQTAEAARITAQKLASLPPAIASAGLDQFLPRAPEKERTGLGRMIVAAIVKNGLKAWLDKPRGNFPLGVLSGRDAAEIGANTQIARMSPETLAKQKAHHPELTAEDYTLAQIAIEKGQKYRQDERNLAYVLEMDNGLVVIVKATMDGKELYITSLYHISHYELDKEKEIRRLKRGKKG